jgi:hypothetical protein
VSFASFGRLGRLCRTVVRSQARVLSGRREEMNQRQSNYARVSNLPRLRGYTEMRVAGWRRSSLRATAAIRRVVVGP